MIVADILKFLATELAALEKAAGYSTAELLERVHLFDQGKKKGIPAVKVRPWLTLHGLARELQGGQSPKKVAAWARRLLGSHAPEGADVDALVARAAAPQPGAEVCDILAWVISELERDVLPKEVQAWLGTLDPAVARWLRQRLGE